MGVYLNMRRHIPSSDVVVEYISSDNIEHIDNSDGIGVKLTHVPTGITVISIHNNTQSKNITDALNKINSILSCYVIEPKNDIEVLINKLILAKELCEDREISLEIENNIIIITNRNKTKIHEIEI